MVAIPRPQVNAFGPMDSEGSERMSGDEGRRFE
jgi:hypothetical protein